jgi:hypothetical protein
MEFHIAREIREKLEIDDRLFSYTGNVVFSNVTACRQVAKKMNDARGSEADPSGAINAGALFAMGLIDELNHALVERYRKEIDPAVLTEAMKWFAAQATPAEVDRLIRTFTEMFPNVAVYRGALSAEQWLAQITDKLPNREAAVEELLMLWLANRNPAFKPFCELFEDTKLKEKTIYQTATTTLPSYFATRPPLAPEIGTLLDALQAPFLASPDSLTGQLEFIREKWTPYLGEDLKRVLLAIDVIREEDLAIWMRFHPPAPDNHRHGAPGWGGDGFVGDEYIGFDEFYGPDGTRRKRYATDYQAPLVEYENFSADQAWMPNVVLMAKSTYVWLEQLSKKYGRHIHRLDHVPDEELRLMAERGMTGLWLIGLWERSIASRTIKRLRGHTDAVASAYSLKEYQIAEDLGGNSAYENLRDRAARFGLRLASDMVPNHMGLDSNWVIENPEWFISRWESPFPSYSFDGPDLSTDSRVEIKIEDHYFDQTDAAVAFRLRHYANGETRYIYHGNDGTTFAWNDTAQLDYSRANVREHVIQTILHVARLFPIIRFDAAMVLAKRHVQRLWFPLPGAGGSIPSRAENAVSQEEFDAMMPHEFWREVVDRVAVEVPGTLLLAEAFWMLEGYFVRTLGMHRVYNSAFMHMLKDEENAKYRSYLKKTIEFDPDILKRYVNFMSNPDEKTAIDQFGSGDKYFGVATLMATLPGLPMFAHGQIEGFTERYGMEFKRAKMDEWPNEGLVQRHQHEIAPLLHNRRIFADSTNFVLYDFWHEFGGIDENVYAYSNRFGGDRSVVLYNNSYGGTKGTIHTSAAAMDKGSGELRQRSLADGLALPDDNRVIVVYRDAAKGLEYLRRASDFHSNGLTMELRGYQYAVLLNWREYRSTAEYPWDALCDALHGAGVHSADEALQKLRLRPAHDALRSVVSSQQIAAFAEMAQELAERRKNKKLALPKSEAPADSPTVPLKENVDSRLSAFVQAAEAFYGRVSEILGAERVRAPEQKKGIKLPTYGENCTELVEGAVRLTSMERSFSAVWPAGVRRVLPSEEPTTCPEETWAPVLAWLVVRSFPAGVSGVELFDTLMLRAALAEIFSAVGLKDEAAWKAAARVRILLSLPEKPASSIVCSRAFWNEPDVRWLTGLHESGGVHYFNKERFEDLMGWLQLPALVEVAEHTETVDKTIASAKSIGKIEASLAATCAGALAAGYALEKYLAPATAPAKTEEPATT